MGDILDSLNTLVENAGLLGASALLSIILVITMVSMFAKRMKGLTDAIVILTDKVSVPYLDVQQSMFVFRSVSSECIQRSLAYLGDVLEKNSIQERRAQIEQNIEREIKNIMIDEAGKLSTINSVCGDMGQTLLSSIDWETIKVALFGIFFSNDPIKSKIQDIKILLKDQSDKVLSVIQTNGVHNK